MLTTNPAAGAVATLEFDAEGWCAQAVREPSPNCDARPDPSDIGLLVIHYISLPPGRFGGPYIADLFCNRLDIDADPSFVDLRELRVSSHFLIGRDGALTQFVSAKARAWHAGLSSFAGRSACNDFSIGIELEGDGNTPFDERQYRTLLALTLALQAAYPLADVAGHEHIAPGRKTDPGPYFDWQRYRAALAQQAMPAPNGHALRFPFLLES
ncbi:MAG: 1,6-anhydro-N-acetylmuramyl-L-alanine amidase AmpD [Burkholderiaceae bacterium]|nr:1,6-anhydro-N-acetylmuramyl-L-alanine amidase AmpD [Burkholderiaceae bacterium]